MTVKYKEYTITYTTNKYPDGTMKNYIVVYSPPMPYKIMNDYERYRKEQ